MLLAPHCRHAAILTSWNSQLALPTTGGVSSSASLTGVCVRHFAKATHSTNRICAHTPGAVVLSLNHMLRLDLSLDQLSQSDYGEYYLGKSAGAADKLAQLNAYRGQVRPPSTPLLLFFSAPLLISAYHGCSCHCRGQLCLCMLRRW